MQCHTPIGTSMRQSQQSNRAVCFAHACTNICVKHILSVHMHTQLGSTLGSTSAYSGAGLWEFPSSFVPDHYAADDKDAQQAAVDRHLAEWQGLSSLQSLGSLQLIKRVSLGSLVHTFSHIQQTMHVQLLVLQVCQLPLSMLI